MPSLVRTYVLLIYPVHHHPYPHWPSWRSAWLVTMYPSFYTLVLPHNKGLFICAHRFRDIESLTKRIAVNKKFMAMKKYCFHPNKPVFRWLNSCELPVGMWNNDLSIDPYNVLHPSLSPPPLLQSSSNLVKDFTLQTTLLRGLEVENQIRNLGMRFGELGEGDRSGKSPRSKKKRYFICVDYYSGV